MTDITAEVVRHSVAEGCPPLATLRLRLPETLWNEVLTHRVFSRNASSSRAVPTAKFIEEARSPALRVTPIYWGVNQRGMQSGPELTGDALDLAKRAWDHAACDAAYHAEILMKRGLHKEVCNQVLKPFVHTQAVVTSTEWMNFFGLRLDPDAKPEMRALTRAVWDVLHSSEPQLLRPGEWHLPFVDDDDWSQFPQDLVVGGDGYSYDEALYHLQKVSVARCARISYTSHETGRRSTVEEDIALFDRLKAGGDWSPFEHVATPDETLRCSGSPHHGDWLNPSQHGNLTGWRQLRKFMPGEACRRLPEGYDGLL